MKAQSAGEKGFGTGNTPHGNVKEPDNLANEDRSGFWMPIRLTLSGSRLGSARHPQRQSDRRNAALTIAADVILRQVLHEVYAPDPIKRHG